MTGDGRLGVEEWMDGDGDEPDDAPRVAPGEVGRAERRLERRGRMMDWSLFVNVFVVPSLAVLAVVMAARVVHDMNKRADAVVASEAALAQTVRDQAAAVDRLSQAVVTSATRQDRLDAIAAALAKLETAQTDDDRKAALDELRRAGEMRPQPGPPEPPPGEPTKPAAATPQPATTTTTDPARPGPTASTTSTTASSCRLLPLSCGLPPTTEPG